MKPQKKKHQTDWSEVATQIIVGVISGTISGVAAGLILLTITK